MNNTLDTITIPGELDEHATLDFTFLRQEGIKHIQTLAGKVWTDHNVHDPGITILDQLCYAITDLGYRINHDIKDLITNERGSSFESLFSPAQILTVNPVTLTDIRKVVLDVEGVKNAWVEKVTQYDPEVSYNPDTKSLNLSNQDGNAERLNIAGLLRVSIEKSESTALGSEILPAVTRRLHACRNLCEDFAEIRILDLQWIVISGAIEIGQVEDINAFAANVLYRVADFISPQVKFYTLQDLLNKGKRTDEIFEGPALQHGFIDDNELLRNNRRTELHASDIIREIMNEPEVLMVKNIAVASGSDTPQNWRLLLDKEKAGRLNIRQTLSNLRFVKNELPLAIDADKVEELFSGLRDKNLYFPLEEFKRDLKQQPGKYRDLKKYYSIQHQFPELYGIGTVGLPPSATPKRVAMAKQLKAYLLFFEQVLANYFAQVAGIKDLFSFYTNPEGTYSYQSIVDLVPGASELIDTEKYEQNLSAFSESSGTAAERKNRLFNHLLSRFSENLVDYSLWLNDQSMSATGSPVAVGEQVDKAATKLASDKLKFLQNYPLISNDRGRAFNYKLKDADGSNVSGLEQRIASKLGITLTRGKSLADGDREGFYMLEHILLRPIPEDFSMFAAYQAPRAISDIQPGDRNFTKCFSTAHGLQNGERIEVRGSNTYDGKYIVAKVLTDSFQVSKLYIEPGTVVVKDNKQITLTPTWQRIEVDTKIMLLTRPVTGFSAGAKEQFTICSALNHGLDQNETIEISGTKNYDGIYQVGITTTNTFEIARQFAGDEATGRWANVLQRKDPYSLQLTFIFPNVVNGAAGNRFQNSNFRAFIEHTIREETPVHLTVYIRWLEKEELINFENTYQVFLEQLSTF